MKLHFYQIVLLTLSMGWLSCTDDIDNHTDETDVSQQEKFQPTNPGTNSSWFAIDDNIISFAVPNLINTIVHEIPPRPNYGGPNAFSPYYWLIALHLAKGTDVTKLSPIITLAPGATITWIYNKKEGFQVDSKQVNYQGVVDIGAIDFSKQVDLVVITPDGSTVTYAFLASDSGNL
ncbi:MAG: hypothetical protein LBE56_05465 [Tannerella sp.]|jgi:hypothetical protein|nr:hypothetical protein [Tannerella sp.]